MKPGMKITAVFFLVLLIIGIVGVQSYFGIQRITETNRWVIHTHEVLEKLEHVLSVLKDAETGQRGFVLTGEDRYLQPYNASAEELQREIDVVASLTQDNPEQRQSLEQLRKLTIDKLAELQETITLRRKAGMEATLSVIRSDRGKKIMDEIRTLVSQMERREEALLDMRNRAASQIVRRSTLTLGLGVLMSLVFLGIAAVIVTGTMKLVDRSPVSEESGSRWVGIIVRYIFAAAAVGLAVGLRVWLVRSFGPMPLFITWYPMVLLVALVAGGGPGVVATLLSVLATDYWFIEPIGQFSIAATNDAVAVGIFTGTGIFMSVLAERLQRARRAEAISVTQEKELALLNMGNLTVLDLDHRIVRWSEGNHRLYGFDANETRGRRSHDLLQTNFSRPLEQIQNELLEKGHWDGVVTRRSKEGTQLSVAILWTLRRDEREKPVAILEVSTDITRQKLSEESLRQQTEELQRTATLLNETQSIAHVGGWELDLTENTLYWTDETFRIHETSPSEYTPTVETAIAFYSPESMPIISAAVKESIEQGKDFFLELQLITAKGRLIWVETVGKAIRRDSRTVKVLGAFRDVTDRKQAEAIRLANVYNRSLLEASLDPLVTIDPNGKITDVNIATETVTGRGRGELIGTDFSDYFTDPKKARAGYQQAFRESSVADYALELRHTDGHVTPVLYNAAVYRDEAGNVIGVFAAARDITELKKAEENLRESEARFRLMVDGVKDYAIIMLDTEGNVVNWNEGAQRIKGYLPQEIIGRHFSCFYPEEDIRGGKPAQELHEAAVKGRFEDEGIRIRKDGSRFFANMVLTALRDDAGTLKGFSKVTRDITEHKKAEEEIRKLNRDLETRVVERTAELENSNRELEAFAYSVSHDLRTPLRSIEGFSLALLEDYADKLDDTGKGYLERVRNATMRMGQLIDDLLKLSRVTRSEMKREQVNMSAIVKGIAERLKHNDPGRNAQFTVADGLTAYGDERLLTVVLENLISNAWKFSEKGAPSVIEFGVTKKDGIRTYFVQDNGAGFDMAYADKLFTPFQRLHKLEEFPGTGIGLATVKRVISRHGGRVWIEAEQGKGATVFFTI
jgi:PAS domain S-box-containing protein